MTDAQHPHHHNHAHAQPLLASAHAHQDRAPAHQGHAPGANAVTDPVCGMGVDPRTMKHRAEHDGRPYYFCSAGCRTKFVADPEHYLDPATAPAEAEAGPEGTIYTCPMHPEIRQPGPGACPICGMALEPVAGRPRTPARAPSSPT